MRARAMPLATTCGVLGLAIGVTWNAQAGAEEASTAHASNAPASVAQATGAHPGRGPASVAQGSGANAGGAPANAPATGAQAAPNKLNAAYPKGHYSALNALPDWGGVWILNRPAPGAPPPERPALKGQYLKDYEAWRDAVKAKGGEVPHEGSYCAPPGMPGIMAVGQYPVEFLFTPGRVTTHHEAWMQWRNIYTDGRGHPDDLETTFQGDSIGHWKGATLFVETVGIKPAVALGMGMKHSPQMKILEQIHLQANDPDTLVDEMTIEDSEALEKPYVHAYTFKRSRDWQLLEFECAENDRNPVDAAGKTGFKTE